MSEKKQKIFKTTPVGEVRWFKLVHPDQKFNKYQCDLVVEDSPEVRGLIEQIEELTEQAVEEAKAEAKNPAQAKKIKDSGNRPIEEEYNEEGESTGRYVIKMRGNSEYKCSKSGEMKKLRPPRLFDSKNKEIKGAAKDELKVFNGSKIRAQIELSVYANSAIGCGVTIKPRAVQIIEILETDGFSGFEEVEDGYEMESNGFEDAAEDDSDF